MGIPLRPLGGGVVELSMERVAVRVRQIVGCGCGVEGRGGGAVGIWSLGCGFSMIDWSSVLEFCDGRRLGTPVRSKNWLGGIERLGLFMPSAFV